MRGKPCKIWLSNKTYFCERYLAICRPLSPLSRSSTGKAKKMIGLIWLISFISASPWAFFTKVNYLAYDGSILEESAWCSIPFNKETRGSLYGGVLLCSLSYCYFALLKVYIYTYSPMCHLLFFLHKFTFSEGFTIIRYKNFNFSRIGLTLHRNKMKRCAASCGGGECEAER